MDRIFIEELVVFAQIGVYDWEQQIKQKLVFDLEMAWDCQKAAETDDVQYCLNYAEVMIYTIDRETPDHDLEKATHKELDKIGGLVKEAGIPVSVSY